MQVSNKILLWIIIYVTSLTGEKATKKPKKNTSLLSLAEDEITL